MASTTPPAELVALVNSFLESSGYTTAAKQLQKQAKKQGLELATDGDLISVFQSYQAQKPAIKAETSDDDSSDASSESDSAEQPSKKRKTSDSDDDSSDASSESSDSDNESDDSESEDEAPPAKKSKITTKKTTKAPSPEPVTASDDSSSASSESESSESEDSSDSGSDSSDSDSDDESSSSEDESSSDDSDDSESESDSSSSDSESSESEAETTKKSNKTKAVKTKPAKKLDIKPEPESSASSSTMDEDTTEAKLDTLLVPVQQAPAAEEDHIHPDRKRKLPDSFASKQQMEAIPATDENVKRLKKENVPFSRIPKDQYVDPRLASNAFVSYDYAQKAHEALIVTKGKAFTKAKNKGKRGSYRGGKIDETPKGIKFED